MVTRFIVIGLSFFAAVLQAQRGLWVEAVGLVCLGVGLVLLRMAATRPAAKPLAWVAFAGTVAAMIVRFVRVY